MASDASAPEPVSPIAPKAAEGPPPRAGRPAAAGSRPLVWMAAGFVTALVLAGLAAAVLAPRLNPERAPEPAEITAIATPPPPDSPAAPAAPAAEPDASPPAGPAAFSPDPFARDDSRFAALAARVELLETEQARLAEAAAQALAAAALLEATQGSAPFAAELSALADAAPPSAELAALARHAEAGAPSRTALAADFPDYAARAAAAARAPGEGAGLFDRIGYAISRIVSVRRTGEVKGGGVDAVLARAERLVEDGRLEAALAELDRLPDGPREALAGWRTRAERRADIDRHARALRERALTELAAFASPGGAP